MNLDTVQGVLCMNKPTEFTSFDAVSYTHLTLPTIA